MPAGCHHLLDLVRLWQAQRFVIRRTLHHHEKIGVFGDELIFHGNLAGSLGVGGVSHELGAHDTREGERL